MIALSPGLAGIDPETQLQLEREALYANYIDRQARDVEALQRDEKTAIPDGFDFAAIQGLSNELRAKLEASRPASLAHAARIDGMTPAALALLLAHVRQGEKAKSA